MNKVNNAFIYILKSIKDNKNYIGSTTNLQRRLKEHQLGRVKSTKYRRPLKLIGYQQTKSIKEASQLEKKYKKSNDVLKRAIKTKQIILISGISSVSRAHAWGA